MLDKVVNFITDELNAYFQAQTGVIGDTVFASAIVNDAGKYAMAENSVATSIINIEEDTLLKPQQLESRYQQGQHVQLEPAIRLNLYLIFAAHYSSYDQALKHISLILTYFQSHSVFSRSTSPMLVPEIERITVDLQSINYDQLNQIWAYIGAKHLPSVIYKVSLIKIQDQAITGVSTPITAIDTQLGSR